MPEIRPDKKLAVQITTAEAEEGKQDELLALMTERARFMARQPGFVSTACTGISMEGASSTMCNGPVANSCWLWRIIRPSSGRSGRTAATSPRRSSQSV